MYSNLNVINNCNAKTSNVLDNFNQCKNFVKLETDAFIVAATLTYFGMASLDAKEEETIPPFIINENKKKENLAT